MRIFITGASGFLGFTVAKAFRRHGHEVFGLVRNRAKALMLQAAEITPVIGDLHKPHSYIDHIELAEVFVHCANHYDKKWQELDRETIDTFFSTCRGNPLPKAFLYTGGVWEYGPQTFRLADESTAHAPLELVRWRHIHSQKVLQTKIEGLRSVVIHPGIVYGGHRGLPSLWFKESMGHCLNVVGEGKNCLAMVHVKDLARAYVLAAEKELSHLELNIVDDSHFTAREIAEAICASSKESCEIRHLSDEAAWDSYGELREGLKTHQLICNNRAKRLLGWEPRYPNFVANNHHYYLAWKARVAYHHV